MKEVDFIDRVPTYPGRYKLTPVAGQADIFDFERADEPIENGTPMNKAAFDSIIQSRLTGRYYTADVTTTQIGTVEGITANPIPVSGWTNNGLGLSVNELYRASASLGDNNYPSYAFDGSENTAWIGQANTEQWLQIELPSAITLYQILLDIDTDDTTKKPRVTVKGSNNGVGWVDLLSTETTIGEAVYEFSHTGLYKYYRLTFEHTVPVKVYNWEFAEYSVPTFENQFLVDAFPASWTIGQKASIEIPETASGMGVTENTLNGIAINTILQAGKRYELRYTDSGFVAKEV